MDALYQDPGGGLEIVEYKLTDEANDELDRAQVALYRELLRSARGVEARPIILRFSPTLREAGMTEQRRTTSATDSPPSTASRPIREGSDRQGQPRRKNRAPGRLQGQLPIVLDEGGAERLLGKGDLLANLGRGLLRAQAPLLGER
jgi:hypothetical protein